MGIGLILTYLHGNSSSITNLIYRRKQAEHKELAQTRILPLKHI